MIDLINWFILIAILAVFGMIVIAMIIVLCLVIDILCND